MISEVIKFFDSIDKAIVYEYFLHWESPALRNAAYLYSNKTFHIIWIGILILAFLILHRKRALRMILVLFFSLILTNTTIGIIKKTALRPRPITALNIYPDMKYDSFPSGHSGNAMALALCFYLFWPLAARVAVPLLFLVALSRFFSLKHYPFDIVMGALIGMLSTYLFYYLFEVFEIKKHFKDLRKFSSSK